MKKALNTLSDWVNKIVVPIASIIFVILVLATIIQVVGRYFLEKSMPWTEELARFSFIWATLLGASVLVKTKGHPGVDAITGKLHGYPKLIQELFLVLIIGAVSVIGVIYGFQLVQVTMQQPSAALGIPYGCIYLSFPVSCIVIIFHQLSEMADLLSEMKKISTKEGAM